MVRSSDDWQHVPDKVFSAPYQASEFCAALTSELPHTLRLICVASASSNGALTRLLPTAKWPNGDNGDMANVVPGCDKGLWGASLSRGFRAPRLAFGE
jgi:hypothetical protein